MRLQTAQAMMFHASAPNALAHPLGPRVRLAISESEAVKIGMLDRWRAALRRRERRQRKKAAAAADLQRSVAELLQRAQAQGWSQRKLAAKADIARTTFRRVLNLQVNPKAWLPKVRAAVSRLELN